MQLDRYKSDWFERGAPKWKEAIWIIAEVVLSSWLPGSAWRRTLLRCFGAKIGNGVVLKPGIRVKFPWRLSVGDYSWIGQDVWIDNLANVEIGAHACLSQGAYLCTGSHDWRSETFDLITSPIAIEDHAWVGAKAMLAPGSVLRQGAVLSMSSFGRGELTAWTIYAGNPALAIRMRKTSPIQTGT